MIYSTPRRRWIAFATRTRPSRGTHGVSSPRPNRGVVVENQRRDVSIVDEDATERALTFADIMAPSTSARPSRRALAVYEKTFVCGVDRMRQELRGA